MERILTGYQLIEAPTIDEDGSLLFSDTVRGGVRRLKDDGTVEDVVLHRKGIGGIVVHADGGYVVSGRNVSWKRTDGQTVILIDRQHDGMSFNDLCTDPEGRIYVGSLEFDPLDEDSPRTSGELYLIDLDGSSRVVATDVRLTNGLGVSPDGHSLYHSDTEAHAVWHYDRATDGSLSNRRALLAWDDKQPDGLAVAADGSVWVAMADSAEVIAINAEGDVITTVSVEVPMVTSVCFGGDELNELYIVTGERGAPDEIKGGIYRMPAPTQGLPVPLARIRP